MNPKHLPLYDRIVWVLINKRGMGHYHAHNIAAKAVKRVRQKQQKAK